MMDKSDKDIPSILIVDDKPMNLLSLSAVIQDENLKIVQAGSGNEALYLILDEEFALILLDVQMPGMDGFETAELIRSNPKSRHIPIIFVTAVSKDEQHLFKGYDSGAVDYLFKPIDPLILRGKIKVFIDLHIQKKKGEILSLHLKDALAEAESSKRIVEEQNLLLKELAIKDGLTGLYNHRHMQVIMDSEFNRAVRYKTDLSCLLLDIDYFKEINDTFGHPFGDYVLKEFARSLGYHMRYTDFLFRYGGEEFLVLLPQTDQEGALSTSEKFRSAIESHVFSDSGHQAMVTVSIGVASIYINQPESYTQLITFADQALLKAKALGRNRVVTFKKNHRENGIPILSGEQGAISAMESMNVILAKTKKMAISSIEFLARESGNAYSEKRKRMLNEYITLIGYHLALPLPQIETFKLCATVHDCFQSLLTPCAERPDDDYLKELKQIPAIFEKMTKTLDLFADERKILSAQHENFDGSGFPKGLKRDEIPLGARIFAITDAFVSLCITCENYGSRHDDAVLHLAGEAGKQFDPDLVTHFLTILEKCEPNKLSKLILEQAKSMINCKNEGL